MDMKERNLETLKKKSHRDLVTLDQKTKGHISEWRPSFGFKPVTGDISDYKKKYNEITGTVMEKLAKMKENENLVISPLSIIMLLAIAADATNGITRDEIVNLIGQGISYNRLMDALAMIRKKTLASGSLLSSNAVCVNNNISHSISEGYEDRLKEVFDGRLFSSADMVRDVNAWVEEKTKGMIKDAVDESTKGMLACLMNAIAFEAEWMDQYEEDDIHTGEFHNADGTVSEVQMLRSFEDKYIDDESYIGFVKPYRDKKYAFMALLPKEKDSSCLSKELMKIDFTKLFTNASFYGVAVNMPEFKYDFGEDLSDLFKELGINTMFSAKADFSPMSSEWLKVDSIIHKAHIEIDRKGTKAAAAAIAYLGVGAAPCLDYKAVCLDRPFVYAIINTETELPVFTGIYNHAD